LGATAAIFAADHEDRLRRLYQWLTGQASFFRHDAVGHGTSRTVRTEVTVRREGTTLQVGAATVGFDTCPLCGGKLAPLQAEQARPRLLDGAISQETPSVDSEPP